MHSCFSLWNKSAMANLGHLVLLCCALQFVGSVASMSRPTRLALRDQVREMFFHGYNKYMEHAYPADELKPLSCTGRFRGTDQSRGDVDDAMGKYSLTLIDALDTLPLLGDLKEFSKAIRNVLQDVDFDNNVIVSVFESNIRVLGGLLGAHVVAKTLKADNHPELTWYNDGLLDLAKDLADRLLPAFNTTTGIPYPRINLRFGMDYAGSTLRQTQTTCTACGGTLILEFAALSRLTNDPVYERKARAAMTSFWQRREMFSNLVGTTIDVQSGVWRETESGIGAGIDSYYEYLLKGYIMLGDSELLNRWNKHYEGVMRYVRRGPAFIDVQMSQPLQQSQGYMDSLLAFWPGLQVLAGDIEPAIDTHQMLEEVVSRHRFLPEAFTLDLQPFWSQHFLRPEFAESTYFLYKATGNHHYLEVGRKIVENLERYSRVPCGFASIADVRTLVHDDRMDSFVLSETFKYLYLLFADEKDIPLSLDNYVFTTEAHLLPTSLGLMMLNASGRKEKKKRTLRSRDYNKKTTAGSQLQSTQKTPLQSQEDVSLKCTIPEKLTSRNVYAELYQRQTSPAQPSVRQSPWQQAAQQCSRAPSQEPTRLKPHELDLKNQHHIGLLKELGIVISFMMDGTVQLIHSANTAQSAEDAAEGLAFMQSMVKFSQQANLKTRDHVSVEAIFGSETVVFTVGAATFGPTVTFSPDSQVSGNIVRVSPPQGCTEIESSPIGAISLIKRGACTFITKARNAEAAGAIGVIIYDTPAYDSPQPVSMTGDGADNVSIPAVFLMRADGERLIEELERTDVIPGTFKPNAKKDDQGTEENKPPKERAAKDRIGREETGEALPLDSEKKSADETTMP